MLNRFLDLFQKEYVKLNENQKKAVDLIDGPVMVIAGPGTGKTQVLSLRIANILKQTDVHPSSILCLTFQESSVLAMKERLKKFIGNDAYKVEICTFHSFCNNIILTYPSLFDFDSSVQPINDIDKVKIFEEILRNENLFLLQDRGDVLKFFHSLSKSISYLKKEYITPQLLLDKINLLVSLEKPDYKIDSRKLDKLYQFQIFYSKYFDLMKERNFIDFEDMIFKVTDAFTKNQELVKFYQERYIYTLVDEFQDTNNSQLKIIESISKFADLDANVFVVGDDDQTIFRFQGADIQNFERFLNIFPNTKIVVLNVNYRSNQDIINVSSRLIENNTSRLVNTQFFNDRLINKTFVSGQNDLFEKPSVEVHEFFNGLHESYWIISKIKELVLQKGYDYKDIAIITRTNNQILDITRFLDKENIPYRIKKKDNVLDDSEIVNLIFFLKFISNIENFNNNYQVFQILNWDLFGLDKSFIINLFLKIRKKSFYEIVFNCEEKKSSYYNHPEFQKVKNLFDKLIEYNKLSTNKSFINLLSKFIDDFDLISYYQKISSNLIIKLGSLFQFVDSRTRFLRGYTLDDFIQEISILFEREIAIPVDEFNIDSANNQLNIITAHSAKGLEFKVVFIYQAVENRWEKHKKSSEFINFSFLYDYNQTSEEIEDYLDERRIFYVAMTRARERLYITYARNYYIGLDGNIDEKEKTPSRFIFESKIDDYYTHDELLQKHEDIVKLYLSGFSYENNNLALNQSLKDLIKDRLNKINLSYTSIRSYNECNYRFLLENICGIRKDDSVILLFGKLVHKGIQGLYDLYSKSSLNEIGVNNLIEELQLELVKSFDSGEYDVSKVNLGNLKNDLEKSIKIYFNYLANNKPRYRGILTEKFFFASLNDIKLKGRVDLIAIIDDGLLIIDFKTGNSPNSIKEFLGLNKSSDDSNLKQVIFYKILLNNSNSKYRNYNIHKLRLEYIDIKKNQVIVFELPSKGIFLYKERSNSKSEKEFDVDLKFKELLEEINLTFTNIKNLQFERTNDINKCKGCPFKNHCKR